MATGILGGSFDPVHLGHLIAADRAAEALGLDTVLFVPCAKQPLKPEPPIAPPEQRLAMLRLALDGDDRFAVETAELDRPGPSYTVDTVRELRRRMPGERLLLILGADAAADLARWRSPDEIGRLAEIAVLTRPGSPDVRSPYAKHLVAIPAIEISASDIRARLLTGKSIRYLVPEGVANYIERHGVYAAARRTSD